MRVTSAFWVGAYLRRCAAQGAMVVVRRKGAAEAGTIFITVDHLDGSVDLFGPAPQMVVALADTADRRFERLAERAPASQIDERLVREIRFDSDLWIVDVEDRQGRNFLDI